MTGPTEVRQDPATRNWVIVAPRRERRPRSFAPAPRSPVVGAPCPFCPGREVETPPELWRLAGPDGGWLVRVIPNKFALFTGDGTAERRVSAGGFVALRGAGGHEVVVESPDHDADLARSDTSVVRRVLEAYRARYRALRDEGWACIAIFRNRGPGAGTSLE